MSIFNSFENAPVVTPKKTLKTFVFEKRRLENWKATDKS